MKNIFRIVLLMISVFYLNTGFAQTSSQDKNTTVNQPVKKDQKVPKQVGNDKDVEESLQKAAEATERAAEKLKVAIEVKADKIARSSKPYVDNFLIATSNLIEKLAIEIEKMMDEKPVKKAPGKQ